MSIADTSLLGTRRLGAPRTLTKTASFLRFFLVDLSRRKAVLLRGGPRWKGLGGIITYTSPSYPLLIPGSFLRFLASLVWLPLLVAVVLLPGQW